mmetsp:Transcript_10086/g.29117  ORF Transcript_10086/g.29117 Transcript_10086/m.29117 type:complete len:190 (-) Transcript_10086:75-644(-)
MDSILLNNQYRHASYTPEGPIHSHSLAVSLSVLQTDFSPDKARTLHYTTRHALLTLSLSLSFSRAYLSCIDTERKKTQSRQNESQSMTKRSHTQAGREVLRGQNHHEGSMNRPTPPRHESFHTHIFTHTPTRRRAHRKRNVDQSSRKCLKCHPAPLPSLVYTRSRALTTPGSPLPRYERTDDRICDVWP